MSLYGLLSPLSLSPWGGMPCPHASTDLDSSHILVTVGEEPAKTQPRTQSKLYMHGDTMVSASSSRVLFTARERPMGPVPG